MLAAPPGLGRTALLRAAADAHRDRGPVLYATATSAGRSVPGGGPVAPLGPSLTTGPSPAAPYPVITPEALARRLREPGTGPPLLVCADDAHTWDPACRSALARAARGLGPGSRTAVLLSAADATAFAGLPTLHLAPLDEAAASALLDRLTGGAASGEGLGSAPGALPGTAAPGTAVGTGELDPVVRAELLREAAGNPRLLAGLTGRLTPDQLAGRTPLPYPLPGGETVLAAHAERLDGLPDRTRTLLLLTAAAQEHEPEGAGADALLLLRAGTRRGLPRDFLDRALFGTTVTEGLLQRTGSRVHFAHRLVARAVLHHAPWSHRRAAHELLATLLTETADRASPDASSPPLPEAPATSPPPGPLAALVQRACAASGPDAALAARLEAAAGAPFPHAERSAALARAALLTPEPALRAARLAAAAEQAGLAGDPALARTLLARAGPRAPGAAGPAADSARGLASYVHGMLALRSGPAADAHEVLLAAAALLGPHDPRRTLDALLGAAEAAWAAGDALGYLDAMNRLARTPLEAGLEHYRAGMCAVLAGRTAEGHALLRHCLDPAGDPGAPAALLRAGVAALVLGDVAAACRAGARALAAVRTRGPDALLPQALEHLAYAELRAGRHAGARAHALEGLHAARRTAQPNSSARLHAVLALAASVEGPAEACAAHADAALTGAGPHGLAQAVTLATWARARADLASGRPGEAAARLATLVGTGPGRAGATSPPGCSPSPAGSRPWSWGAGGPRSPTDSRRPWTSSRPGPPGPPTRARPPNWPAAGPCWPPPTRQRPATPRPWPTTAGRAAPSNGPAPNCCTGSGCAAAGAPARPAARCAMPWSPSSAARPVPGRTGRPGSCGRRGSRPGPRGARRTDRWRRSPRSSSASPAASPRGSPTGKWHCGCRSAPARSTTTSATSSPPSASAPAPNWPGCSAPDPLRGREVAGP